jgi:energy-coupling factor transport system ATP-binding protein
VIVALESVEVQYEASLPSSTCALSGVDLTVEQGECVAIVGPTGSGKTTLLEVMSGLTAPTTGRVSVQPHTDGAEPRTCVGLVHQFPEDQFFEETVFEEAAFGPLRQGLSVEEVERRVTAALERVGLCPSEFGGRSPLFLSAGEKRRVAIACILALDRPFLLLDEPTAGLDPVTRERIVELIENELGARRGVVVVTHDLALADRVAGRTVVLRKGSVLADRETPLIFGDETLLAAVGLDAPPRYALVQRLREIAPSKVDQVAGLLLGAPLADAGEG